MRKLILLALAAIAARMGRRALARGGGEYAAVMSALWELAGLILAAGTAGTAKTRAVEDRLNLLVPRIPVPQAAPVPGSNGGQSSGGNSSFSNSNSAFTTGNSSYSIAGQNSVSAPGGSYSQAWAQQVQATIGTLFPAFNAIQGSYSNTIPAFNALVGSYSATVPAFNALQASYSGTIANLNALVADHNQLVNDHQNLITTLKNTRVIH